ncbi:hypothetical protein U1Q18_010618 [Sarracenia purpurea var. burkii]
MGEEDNEFCVFRFLNFCLICSTIFNPGQVTHNGVEQPHTDYEFSGEGLREAIKNGDTSAVKDLLTRLYVQLVISLIALVVAMAYCYLGLAALFNRHDIAFALMEYGASLDCRNSQGETPLDCAPATLKYKMEKKMEESEQLGPRHFI